MSDSDMPDAGETAAANPSSLSEVDAASARHPGHEPLPGAPRSEHLVLGTAIAIGVSAALLAKDRPPGIGTTFVLLAGLGGVLAMHGRFGLRLPSRNRLAVAGALALLALAFSLRTSGDLLTLNSVAIILGMVLFSVRVEGRRLRDARAGELAFASVELPVACAVRGWFVVTRALRRPTPEKGGGGGVLGGHGRDVLIGCFVAIPILGIFASLLAASDTGFRRLLERTFDFDVTSVIDHAFAILWMSGLALIALIAGLASYPTSRMEERRAEWAGPAVVWIVLGSTCALFAAFLAVQGSYLFGGAAYLEKKTGLTAAEYARDGFYELIVVSGLTVALVLAARVSFRMRVGSSFAYRLLAPLLSVLAIVLLGSAMARLIIYADRFGLTGQRIYAVAILVWIAAVLAWLSIRIARNEALQLGAFAACAGLVAVIGLNAINPEGLAARTNLDRGSAAEGPVDVSYLMTLSEDAIPTIVERLDALPQRDATRLERELRKRSEARGGGWRSTNLAHERAEAAIND